MGSIMGGAKPAPVTPIPPPPEPAPMPVKDDDAAKRARKRTVAKAQGRSGRASTVLTDFSGDKLG